MAALDVPVYPRLEHLHHDFPVKRFGRGHLDELEHVRAPVAPCRYRQHGSSLSQTRSGLGHRQRPSPEPCRSSRHPRDATARCLTVSDPVELSCSIYPRGARHETDLVT